METPETEQNDTVEEAVSVDSTNITLRTAVRDSLAALGTRTRTQVIEIYASREADKQAAALVKGLDKLTELERELFKIKPVYAGYNVDGQGVGEPMFTKDQLDQRKKTSEQIAKLVKAINKADDKGDFGDLYNIVK
jgi:hypothetical protein